MRVSTRSVAVAPGCSSPVSLTPTTTGQSRFFYRVPQISYPAPLYTPQGIAGATLTLNTNVGTIKYIFNAAGTTQVLVDGMGHDAAVSNLLGHGGLNFTSMQDIERVEVVPLLFGLMTLHIAFRAP